MRQKKEAERRAKEEERAKKEEERRRREAERREAERKEAERREAERKDAERKEAERKEAERREAEKREAEKKKKERPRQERKPRKEGTPASPSVPPVPPVAPAVPSPAIPPAGVSPALASAKAAPLLEKDAWESPSRLPSFGMRYETPAAPSPPRPFYDPAAALGRMHMGDAPLLGGAMSEAPLGLGGMPRRAVQSPPRPVPAPIGPIERPRRTTSDEQYTRPEGILGSAALGDDDELVEPRVPRRVVPNAAPISTFAPAPGQFGYASPWSAPGSRAYPPSFNAPPPPPSLWNESSGWDRARYAFEQPSTFAEPSEPAVFSPPPAENLGAIGNPLYPLSVPRTSAPYAYAPMHPSFSNGS